MACARPPTKKKEAFVDSAHSMFVKTLRAKTLRTEPPTPRAPATKKPRIVYDIGYSWDFTTEARHAWSLLETMKMPFAG